jgi:hypothetical protein
MLFQIINFFSVFNFWEAWKTSKRSRKKFYTKLLLHSYFRSNKKAIYKLLIHLTHFVKRINFVLKTIRSHVISIITIKRNYKKIFGHSLNFFIFKSLKRALNSLLFTNNRKKIKKNGREICRIAFYSWAVIWWLGRL